MRYQWTIFCALLLFCRQSDADVTLALFSEMSGNFAANGEDCRRGYGIAQAAYAGSQSLRFYYGDTQGDGKAAIAEFRKAVDIEKAVAVVTNRSQVGMALNPLSKQMGVPLLGVVGHEGFVRGNPHAYRFFPSADAEAAALAKRLAALKITKAGMVTAEDEWLTSLSSMFRSRFASLGGSITDEETVLESQADVSSTIERLRAASPQAVFVNLGISQSGVVMKRMWELGFRPVIVTNFWSGKEDVIETAGAEAVEGIVFVEPEFRQPRFLEALLKQTGDSRATAVTYSCYAALSSLLQAISRIEGEPKLQSVRSQLETLTSVSLLDGVLHIHDREADLPLAYRTVRAGQAVAAGALPAVEEQASLR